MTFQNAYQGVSKVFKAEILKLIGSACILIAAIVALISAGEAIEGAEGGMVAAGIVAIVFSVAGLVILIIGFIMNLVGLNQAGNDEDYFKNAFIFAIFALVVRFVSGLFGLLNVGGGIADNIATPVSGICEIIVFVLVVYGVVNLADRLHKSEVIGTATKLIVLYVSTYGIALIANLIVIFFGANETVAKIELIMAIITGIFSIIAYIIYLVFLSKAKKMLQEN